MKRQRERIPFQVDVSRVIEVLANQIYQSPLALLRENTQNAFDALLLRQHRGDTFDPRIDVSISPLSVVVADNGIGMTASDLRTHYWSAGSSSKNTPEAKAAGVVGTFGIGAMANFGIADRLVVETESAITGQRTGSEAERQFLSATEECISIDSVPSKSLPGTQVTAMFPPESPIDVAEATRYIEEFVMYVGLPVFVNGELASQSPIDKAVPASGELMIPMDRVSISETFSARPVMRVSRTGEVWVKLEDVTLGKARVPGQILLQQGRSSLRTFRSGFGLATVTLTSAYSFGGVADLKILEPTAGREALTTGSMQLLQAVFAGVDEIVSVTIAKHAEADSNTAFMEWARRHGRFDLCGNLRPRVEPEGDRRTLTELAAESKVRPLLTYAGSDQTVITAVASDDSPLVVFATQNPRRACEISYLSQYGQTDPVQDAPMVLSSKPVGDLTLEEQAVCFRIVSELQTDYFLPADVSVGTLSHGLPILVDASLKPLRIVLAADGATFNVMRQLYRADYAAFPSMVKDFVRNVVFPRVADFVPSSTRQGAEAFLKTIRRTRDVFEYEFGDLDTLGSIWDQYVDGRLTMEEAARRSSVVARRSVQIVDLSSSRQVRDVVPDVVENESILPSDLETGAAPSIMRSDIASDAKLLTIAQGDPALRSYRCFVAISDRAQEERGDFFLQPHATSIVWGGQKVLFVFEHHSGEFGLYYDLQTINVVSEQSGGGPFPTATIVLSNRIYIPVPELIASAFIPAPSEKKRFEVHSDLLFTETKSRKSA
jgi:molecular chaperone HtpG